MTSEQGEPSVTTLNTTENGSTRTDDSATVGGGELIEQEYEQVIKDLNSNPVSFTMPSAEGITMYRGIDGHRSNGHMRKLAQTGLRALVKRIELERARQKNEEDPPAQEQKNGATPPEQSNPAS